MKIVVLLVVLVSLFSIVSCFGDDDPAMNDAGVTDAASEE